jgi:hypothetical protein
MNGVEIVNVRVILRWGVEMTEVTNTCFCIFVLYIKGVVHEGSRGTACAI